MLSSKTPNLLVQCLLTSAIFASLNAWSDSVDVAAAEALAKRSNCTKCHSVDKKKDGPPYKETAAKYKGKSDAEAKLLKHITTGPTIKIDGVEEQHQIVKTKVDSEIKNLVQYILTR